MNETAVARFDAANEAIPRSWKIIGRLPLDAEKGLHPAAGTSASEPATAPSTLGGGGTAPGSIPADEPFVAETYLH